MGAVRFTQGSRVSDSLSSDTEPCLETELLASNDRITLRYSPSLSHITVMVRTPESVSGNLHQIIHKLCCPTY